jgi:hypothetical protein
MSAPIAILRSGSGGGERENWKRILRCLGSEGGGGAQFASRLIGDREVLRTHLSETTSRAGITFISRRVGAGGRTGQGEK